MERLYWGKVQVPWFPWIRTDISISLGILFLTLVPVVCAKEVSELFDVLVYAANAAGVAAAVTASDGGKFTVKVVEPLRMIGGMAAAGGVALMNQGGCGLSGLSGNWSRIVSSFYGLSHGVTFPRMRESERAFWVLLNSSSSIETTLGCHAVNVSIPVEGCIGRVYFECDDGGAFVVKASYIIDASYDGDIMTLSKVDSTYGREPRSRYRESLAGVQIREYSSEESFSLQNVTINPFHENGTVLKYIDEEALRPDGSGDDKLMSFEYFVCLSKTFGNQVAFEPPPGYNPDDFLLLLRQTNALMKNGKYPAGPPLSYFGDVQCYDPIVANITGAVDCLFCCGRGPVNSDQPSLNKGWATSSFASRKKMADEYKYYIKGSLFFLANDSRVPNFTQRDTRRYGYCKDEYVDFDFFPPQLYVRISNRLKGQKILTQNNIVNPRVKKDGVAIGCWPFDQHTVSRNLVFDVEKQEFTIRNEGFFRAHIGSGRRHKWKSGADRMRGTFAFYDVPFGVMVPVDQQQASNLLVPVCISASSVAYSSARIENMFMDLGSAAGVAVAGLLTQEYPTSKGYCPPLKVQSVNVSHVQDVLVSVYKQRIHAATKGTLPVVIE